MSNFIFSIADIFSKCLNEYEVEGYYIGPYQRGYKWKSKTIHDQIPVLLCDLYDAFLNRIKKQGIGEYYLQYITVKRTQPNGTFLFEIIDGQQRLTTITLIFTVLEKYYQKQNLAKNDNTYLLSYARHNENINSIFDLTHSLAADNTTDINNIEEQDKFYLFHAFKTVKSFFDILKANEPDNFDDFVDFFKNDVKIILNKEDEFTSAEEVFSSLNANKVPLTNAYLIKGLLLTKASRITTSDGIKKNFKEILDARSLIAKIWDDMHNWFSQQEVSMYYFGNENAGMDDALELVSHKPIDQESSILHSFRSSLEKGSSKTDNQYELFNSFHERTHSSNDASKYLNEIKHLYKRLRNWYEDNNWYNLIGYYLHTGGKINTIINKSQKELVTTLNIHIHRQLTFSNKENGDQFEKDVSILRYDNNPGKRIHNILLALSVFPEGINRLDENTYRFNFYAFAKEGWTLEHIFPQNPEQEEIDFTEDKEWIITQCEKNEKSDLVKKIKNGDTLSSQDLSFIYDSFPDVHVLGNMALLSSSVNSALSNGLFNTKRKVLLRKMNSGSFVPKHTIDVFSKMLAAKQNEQGETLFFEQDIKIWTEQDATAHLTWMKSRLAELKKEFAL